MAFLLYLQKEVNEVHKNCIWFKFICDGPAFDTRLQMLIGNLEAMTAHNEQITLNIAANYGGRWDMLRAVQASHASNPDKPISALSETALQPCLRMLCLLEPDLPVHTGGESRISNFMLWQSAYTELYPIPVLFPNFSPESLDQAPAWYTRRDRCFDAINATLIVKQLAIG